MEKSPLQLMSRMASVVKGQYQTTKQMEDVVEPNTEDNSAAVSAPPESTLADTKDLKDSPPIR